MNKKIMILGASILQLPAIEMSRKLGLDVVVVDMNPSAVGFQIEGIEKEIISTIDVPAIIEAARRHKINGIMTLATDMPMRAVAAVAKEMDLIGIDDDTAMKATNKAEMRNALSEAGVPVPHFFVVNNEREYREVVKWFKSPFIVKPADSSGSRGIFKVKDISDIHLVEKAYSYCRPYSRSGAVVVEEYMNGPEVSVETLSIDGVCHVIQVTDKLTTGEPHFVEMGHSQPSKLDARILQQIKEVTKMANRAIGIKNGPSHTEIIVTDEGPKIVEIGARLGGDNITTHLVPLSTGVNMVEACIRIALGEKPDVVIRCNKGAAIRYFKQCAGTIKSIDRIESVEADKNIKHIYFTKNVGEKVKEITDSGSRIGFVIAQADTVDIAVEACERAINEIIIRME